MSDPKNEPIEVIVTKKDEPEDKTELEKIKEERDELKAKITALAMEAHQKRVQQLKDLKTNVPDTLIDTMNPEQLNLMLEKYTAKNPTIATPENKGSGGSGTVALNTPQLTSTQTGSPRSVEEWIGHYKSKKYEDNVTLLNDVYKVLMSPSLYPTEQYKACDTLAQELLKKWDKKELPRMSFTETNEDRPISHFGKPHS